MNDKTENIRKPASASDIRAGNAKMRAARKRGNEISKTIGPRSGFRAMQTESGGSASEAEKLRKYRAMSTRIDSDELAQITQWCIDNERAWGPTLLCELSRIPEKEDRERIAKIAIEKRLGLVDLKRMVRLELGSPKSIRSKTARVGRKRTLDWTEPANVFDEIRQVCGVFLSLVRDIQSVIVNEEAETVKVRESLKTTVAKVVTASKEVKLLYRHCNNKLKKYPKG